MVEPHPTGDGLSAADLQADFMTEAAMADLADGLVDAIEVALGPWVRRCVVARHEGPIPARLEAAIEEAVGQAVDDIGPKLRQLLALDIDQQWTNPMAVIRRAVLYPTSLLIEAGVAPAERDETAVRQHPHDVYDLVPASFADLDLTVHESGLLWGAAKAHIHLRRRKHQEVAG
ncbi:MAG: hypothetical protein GY939_03680 [Actinomycetia bacterium]|nr:hypothetical protein [Actinomycetes bacterium]